MKYLSYPFYNRAFPGSQPTLPLTGMQVEGAPGYQQPRGPGYAGNGPLWAGAVLSGMSLLGNALEAGDRNRYRGWQRRQGMTDSVAPVVPGSRGEYTVNEGVFRPDQYIPVQFGATPFAAGGLFEAPMELTPGMLFPLPVTGTPLSRLTNRGAVTPNRAAVDAYRYYVQEKNLAPHIAAGIVGNLFQESGLNPKATEKDNTGNGVGIAQWDKRNRLKGLLQYAKSAGVDPFDRKTQLDYILEEPGESKRVLNRLAGATTPEEAAYIFGKVFERPAEKQAAWKTRTGVARKLYDGKFTEGGEYEVTAAELLAIMAAGGQVEML